MELPSYSHQRRLRMDDAISDYLNDDEVDARRCYEEMLSVIDEWIDYHKKHMEKAQDLKSLMQGNRLMDRMAMQQCIDDLDPDLGRQEFLIEKKACETKYTDIPERYWYVVTSKRN